MDEVVEIGHGILQLFVTPSQSIYWVYLASAVVVATLVYVVRYRRRRSWRAAVRYVFPIRLLRRPSARHDVGVFLINTLLHSFAFAAPLQTLSSWVGTKTWAGLHTAFEPSGAWLSGPMFFVVATVLVFCTADLAFYVAHRLLHRIPLLWAFHKVHHSATVLNPLTVMRRHPGDVVFEGALSGVVMGATYGLLGFLGGQIVEGYTVAGVNALLFLTLLVFNLQHSHVWLRFGPLDRVFISPAAHQIHHSDSVEHFDRNFGNMLSVWDRLAGTYMAPPRRRPRLRFGLGPNTSEYRSIWRLYVVPIIEVFRRFFARNVGAPVGTITSDEHSQRPGDDGLSRDPRMHEPAGR